MKEIVIVTCILLITFYVLLKVRYELHMMQLNSYRNKRYYKWIIGDITDFNRVIELITALFVIFLLITNFSGLAYVALLVVYCILSAKLLKQKQKKALVYTRRAKLLYFTTVLIYFILPVLIFARYYNLNIVIITQNILTVLSFILIGLANILLRPIERGIEKWYYNDAKNILNKFPGLIVIGITGSYGKTSTKHFLYRILSEKYNVLMTPNSYNTTMGVVRTIREELCSTHQVFIVEMGAKQEGDIKEICDLVKPKIGILTSVAEQHLDTFKTIENVKKAKYELINALPKDGLAILNADYDIILRSEIINTKTIFYSLDNKSIEYNIQNIRYSEKGTIFSIFQNGKHVTDLETKILGDYNLLNILSSYILARYLGLSEISISFAVKKIRSVDHRLEIKENNKGITIIDDAFNSNPKGAKMALDVLKSIKGGRKIIITPGMIELNKRQDYYNKIFGEQIADVCDYVILVGNIISIPVKEGLKEKNFNNSNIYVALNIEDATRHLNGIIKQGDVLLYENDLPDTY